MKFHLSLFITLVLLAYSFSVVSQSVKKIAIQDPLHPVFYSITPDDITYGGTDIMNGDKKLIGYRYRRANSNVVMGVLGLGASNNIIFSKTYINNTAPSNIFEIAKLESNYLSQNNTSYILAGVQTSGTYVYPLVLQINANTGTIINQYLLNGFAVPDELLVPCDILVTYNNPSIVKILCIGRSYGAVPPNPKASIYIIDLNITNNIYNVTRFIDNANLDVFYDFPFNFIKSHHYGSRMYGELSFYGLESTSSGNNQRGIVFNKKFNNSPICKAFMLDGASTLNIQVNITEDQQQQSIAVQNNNLDIFIESNVFLSTINYQTYYRKNFSAPFYLTGTSHGSKTQYHNGGWPRPIDFFLGKYQQPGMGGSGYSFLRYNYLNGTAYQTYNYDLNIDFPGGTPPSAFFNDFSRTYHYIGRSFALNTNPNQYFYLIDNDLEQDQSNCVNIQTFTNPSLSISRQDVNFSTSVIASNIVPSSLDISEITVAPPTIQAFCSDFGTRSEEIGNPPPNDNILSQILNSSNTEDGGFTVKEDHSKIDELKATIQDNNLIIEPKIKKIIQLNIYTITGQLIKSVKPNSNIVNMPLHKSHSSVIYMIEGIFFDGSRAIKKVYY